VTTTLTDLKTVIQLNKKNWNTWLSGQVKMKIKSMMIRVECHNFKYDYIKFFCITLWHCVRLFGLVVNLD
jgi:hypothetical protein